jgi:hypothetical protein
MFEKELLEEQFSSNRSSWKVEAEALRASMAHLPSKKADTNCYASDARINPGKQTLL